MFLKGCRNEAAPRLKVINQEDTKVYHTGPRDSRKAESAEIGFWHSEWPVGKVVITRDMPLMSRKICRRMSASIFVMYEIGLKSRKPPLHYD